MDWGLFVKLRDEQLTFDQVRARIDATNFGCDYKVLDDLKPILTQSIYEANADDAKLFKNMIGYRGRQGGRNARAAGTASAAGLDDIPLEEIVGPQPNEK